MLLTITCHGEAAADFGWLLHKNPARPQAVDLSFGRAVVFYPENTSHCCTVAMMLDIAPPDYTKPDQRGESLFDYVSDRPYVSSSFMSTALSKVFGTAMGGRCQARPDRVMESLELTATIAALPCRGDIALPERLFAPLGYEVAFTATPLDEKFPEWGDSPYIDLTLRGKTCLSELLNHLYVLLPVFDHFKHYFVGEAEVDKLLRHGAGWLQAHPEKKFISRRYFMRKRALAGMALDRLRVPDDENAAPVEKPEEIHKETLNDLRHAAVVEALKTSGAASVLDLGCGEGNLLRRLLREPQFTRLTGVDVSPFTLARLERRLKFVPDHQKKRLTVFQSALSYRDGRLARHDAAVAVEVLEHLEPEKFPAFAQNLFGEYRPRTVVLTSPNREFNAKYPALAAESLRHEDHRFEWTRGEFRVWCSTAAQRFGYAVAFHDIGEADETVGSPTQMGVFTLCV